MATADSYLFLAIRVNRRNAAWLKDQIYNLPTAKIQRQFGDGQVTIRTVSKIVKVLTGLASGIFSGNMWISITEPGTGAGGSIACVRANAAGDSITFTYGLRTVVLTEGATGPNGFLRGATDGECAINLAFCINAHPVLGGLMTAQASLGTVNLTGKLPGGFINDIAMSTNDAAAFTLTQFSGGAEGPAQFFPTQVWLNRNVNSVRRPAL